MSPSGSRSFSHGVDAFLNRLSPHGQPQGQRAFPEKVELALLRFQGTETIKQWFGRCVKSFMPKDVEQWRQVEENLAVFAVVSWGADNELEFVTINALKTECSLKDYHDLTENDLEKEEWRAYSQPRHLRLDLDYGTLGPIGTHPLPHVHLNPDGPPRCVLDASHSTNIVVDFMEFVYRHYFPGVWLDWAERTWNRHYRQTKRNPELNPFRAIVSAFAENQIGVLHERTRDVSDLVDVLQREKDSLYELRMNAADRRLMTFPDWRG